MLISGKFYFSWQSQTLVQLNAHIEDIVWRPSVKFVLGYITGWFKNGTIFSFFLCQKLNISVI